MNKQIFPVLVIFIFWLIFFQKFFVHHLYPIPADITVGVYFPWLEYGPELGYPAGVPVKNSLPSDIPSVIYPIKKLAIELWQKGYLPDWNKHILSGTSLLANGQSAVFYPLNLLYWLLPFDLAWSWQVVLQALMASCTMYLLAHYFRLSTLPSLLTGISYAYSGFFTTWLEYNIHGHVLALTPLILLFSLKLIRGKGKSVFRWGSLYALCLALQILAGYPQFSLYTLGIVGIFALFEEHKRSAVWRLAVFTVLGLLISAIQLLPTIDFLNMSNRLVDARTLKAANNGLFPWTQLVTLLVPNYFGNPATGNYSGIGFFDNFSAYSGVSIWILSILALKGRHPLRSPLLVLILASFLLALNTPLSQTLIKLNIFGFASAVASRGLMVLTFSLSLLAGLGLQEIGKLRRAELFFVTSMGAVVLVLVDGLSFFRFWYLKPHPDLVANEISQAMVSLRNLVIPNIVAILSLLSLFVVYRKRQWKNLIMTCLLLLTFMDLYLFADKYLTYVSPHLIFPSTAVTDFLSQQPGRVLGGNAIPMNMWMPYGLDSASGYDALYSLEYSKFLAKLNHDDNPLGRYGHISVIENTPEFHRTGSRYIITTKLTDQGEIKPNGKIPVPLRQDFLRPVFESKSVAVLENILAYPLVYFNDPSQVLSYTEKPNGDLNISFSSTISGTVYTAITNQPSWQVSDKGRRLQISKTNPPYMAIPIEPGEHNLSLRYHPRWFNLGAALTFSGLILSLFGIFKGANYERQAGRRGRN